MNAKKYSLIYISCVFIWEEWQCTKELLNKCNTTNTMKIEVTLTNRHAVLIASAIVLAGMLSVFAFGGSNPSLMGHSALELIVNSSSIVDGSVLGADITANTLGATQIDSASLASECSTITGGAGLCDGGDATGLTSVDQSNFNTCGGATTCSVSCASGSMVGCGCEPSAPQPINDHHITGNTCTCGTTVATTINVRGICIS